MSHNHSVVPWQFRDNGWHISCQRWTRRIRTCKQCNKNRILRRSWALFETSPTGDYSWTSPQIFFGRLIAFFLVLIRKPMKMRRFNARVFLTDTSFHFFDKNWTKYKRPCIAKKKGTYKILVLFLITIDSELRMPSKGKNKKANSGASSAKKKKKHSVQVCHLPEKLVWSTWAATNWSVTYLYVSETHILKFDLKKCTVVQKKNCFLPTHIYGEYAVGSVGQCEFWFPDSGIWHQLG